MDEASGAVAARLALDSSTRPTAIVCYNDNVACGVQNELYRQGITDVAVTGFDNTYIAGLERISLTSVAQNVDEMVDRSVAALTDPESTVTDVLVAPELVARSSTTAMNFLD
jgi:DNA-binding LacI/PurR family transcriptional regulator